MRWRGGGWKGHGVDDPRFGGTDVVGDQQVHFRGKPRSAFHQYRTPPKARKKKRRIVHVEEPSYDEPQRGDLRERIETVQRRPPVATGAGLDPMIAQAAAPRPKPRPDNKLDFSSCPTRRLQAMLKG